MRFKQWIEDAAQSGEQYGNDVSPDDNGLVRPQYLTRGVPGSEMATKLFGGDRVGRKFMSNDPDLSYLLGPPGKVPHIGQETGEPINHGIAKYDSPHGSHRYVYYHDGQAVSAIQVVSQDKRSGARVANVFTHPDFRRQRFATQLLQQAKSDFRSVGFPPEHERSDSANKWLGGITEE
jgi:hypothetical protein